VYHDIPSRSAALNMVLLKRCSNGRDSTIRFIHGSFQRFRSLFWKICGHGNHAPQRDLARRWTGGGIVFHGDDLPTRS